MSRDHGLDEDTVNQITQVFSAFPEVAQAVLFGSRAKGTYRPGSDIDLALRGDSLDWRDLGRIDDVLDDLLLPYTFSLITLNDQTDASVAAHIDRVGFVFYDRMTLASEHRT
jgi:uncharacterized protein